MLRHHYYYYLNIYYLNILNIQKIRYFINILETFVLFGFHAPCLIVLYFSLDFYSLLFLSWIRMAGQVGIFSRVDTSVKCIVRILEVDEYRERKLTKNSKLMYER